MATQKNTKSSKATVPKGKSSNVAPVRKSKASTKGKQTVKSASALKPKTTSKALPATKAKKATQVAKKAAPVAKKLSSKPSSKLAAKKQAPAKTVTPKSKAIPGKHAQRVQSKHAAASKAAPKSVAKITAKALSPSKAVTSKASKLTSKIQPKVSPPLVKKPIASIPVVLAKAKDVMKKHVSPIAGIQSKLPKAPAKPVALAKAVAPAKPVALAKAVAPAKPVALAKAVAPAKPAETHKPQPKSVPDKPVVLTTKSVMKPTGSKISDLAKPSLSSKPMVEKPKDQPKAKEFQRKSLKQSTVHSVKPFNTMSDKKENKLMGATYSDEPQKTRYNDKELEEFDQLIDQKLIVAREQLEFYLKQLEDMAENPDNKIKSLDDGLSTLESERVSSMAARQQKLIQHLENAKIRIKNKVYGICRETGRLISKERLRAVPHATLSIEAKQAQN